MNVRLCITIIYSLVFASGCATTRSGENSGAKESKEFTLGTIPVSEHSQKISKSQCPRSEKTWKTSHWTKVLVQANACVAKGDFEKVGQMGEHLAGEHVNSPWGPYFMSVSAGARGDWERALWLADLATKKAPQVGLIHYQKGRALWHLKEFTLAIKSMKEAIGHDGNITEGHLFLGQVYFRDRDLGKATKHFQAVLRADNNHTVALNYLGLIRKKQGESKEAIELLERSVRNSPEDVVIRLALAEAYEQMLGDYQSALDQYKIAKKYLSSKRGRSPASFEEIDKKIKKLKEIVAREKSTSKVSMLRPVKGVPK